MSGEWTQAEDRLLRTARYAGMSASKIAQLLGRTRNAVIGRIHRLERTVFPCMTRQRADRLCRREKLLLAERDAVMAMQKNVDDGMERNSAIVEATKKGLSIGAIGWHFGISRQRVSQIVLKARIGVQGP